MKSCEVLGIKKCSFAIKILDQLQFSQLFYKRYIQTQVSHGTNNSTVFGGNCCITHRTRIHRTISEKYKFHTIEAIDFQLLCRWLWWVGVALLIFNGLHHIASHDTVEPVTMIGYYSYITHALV